MKESRFYLDKLSKQFEAAKADALALIHASDLRKPVLEIESDFIPFDCPNQSLTLEAVSALNPVVNFDVVHSTPKAYAKYPLPTVDAVVCDDELQTVLPAKQVNGEICGLDWVSITMFDTTFDDSATRQMTSNGLRHNAIVKNISDTLTSILGFGISKQNKNGIHFYDTSYVLEHDAGLVALGGQRGTVLIQINGTGCDFAKSGWRSDLYAFLKMQAINPKITRVDLCHDDLNGEYTNLAWFAREYDKGGFSGNGRKPRIEMFGNWKHPDGTGRTLQIGSRSSSKLCRIYEKGKELGDKSSPWIRTEVEFKSKGYFIPLEVLISPSNFFSMTYKCFHVFDKKYQYESMKFERIEKEKQIAFVTAVAIFRKQYGRYLYCFRKELSNYGMDDTALLDFLTDIENKKYPERLNILSIPEFFKEKSEVFNPAKH